MCCHQQCSEKYIKARLNEASIQFRKTHDLDVLLNQALTVEPLWAAFRSNLKRLSDAAIIPRYPGGAVTKAEAQRALKTCRAFRKEARDVVRLAQIEGLDAHAQAIKLRLDPNP